MGFAQDVAGMFGGNSGFGSGDPDSTSDSSISFGGVSAQSGLSTGLGAAGLGLDIFGSIGASNAASKAAGISENITGLEGQVNAQRQLAMQVSARRQQMQIIRTNQQAKAQATAAATSQGAQFGSGLQGGLAQIAGQSGSNLLGEDQQLSIGNAIFGLDTQITQQKIAQTQAQSQGAADSGLASLGGTLLKAAPTIASLFI